MNLQIYVNANKMLTVVHHSYFLSLNGKKYMER